MSLATVWEYAEGDPALALFTAAVKAWQLPILPGQRILELGCNESDFLPRMARLGQGYDLHGVDWRPSDKAPTGWTFTQGSAWDFWLHPDRSFDWVILLGALEHFGLGYYGDPVAPFGDVATIQTAARWLKPGGQLYFDVPCNPQRAQTDHFRTYAPADLRDRLVPDSLWADVTVGYSEPEPTAGTWVPQPRVHRAPYHFAAVWAQKRPLKEQGF